MDFQHDPQLYPNTVRRPSSPLKDPFATLADLVAGEEAEIDLAYAALVIAAGHCSDLNIDLYLDRIDLLAAGARLRIGRLRRPDRILEALAGYLFVEQGFRGNTTDYYDPINSLFHQVLDHAVGLPITLSVLTIAVGQRLGLPLYGVGMPLHFLVKYATPDEAIYFDPFYGGEILNMEGCQRRLEMLADRRVKFDPAYLQVTSNRRILYRLLNNLKQADMRLEQPARAGRVVDQMLIVDPASVEDVRDRGLLFLQENSLSRGITWLSRYLEKAPGADDTDTVRSAIAKAYGCLARLN